MVLGTHSLDRPSGASGAATCGWPDGYHEVGTAGMAPMVRIAPTRCREILAQIERLAILELEAEARRLMDAERPMSRLRES